MEIFAQRLRELRKKEHRTQAEIAAELGISVTCYAGYEQGAHQPDLKTLVKIAKYFEISSDYLLGISDK